MYTKVHIDGSQSSSYRDFCAATVEFEVEVSYRLFTIFSAVVGEGV